MIKKIPAGTRIYVKKKNSFPLYIRPDQVLTGDNLYVAYDVRVDGVTVIPKGTRVTGDWVTESTPTIAAQLQLTHIYLDRSGMPFFADSETMEGLTKYNQNEIDDASHLHEISRYRSTANIVRRMVGFHCKIKTLLDNNADTLFIEIPTKEITVTLTTDFMPFPKI